MYLKVLLGNAATSIWWLPWLAKYLHELRGVRFQDRNSVFLGRGVILDNSHPEGLLIGRNACISAYSVILAHELVIDNLDVHRFQLNPTTIKENVFIGTSCLILPGVTIGSRCIVGAGSVVTKSFPSNTILAGNPARSLRQRITD